MPLTGAAAAAPIIPSTPTVPGASPLDAAAGASTTSSGASGVLGGMGSEAFMKLLMAQMRYQNPMEPTDSSQYLSQISQYAMVEQMQKVNQGQQEIRDYQRAMTASSMIGKVVAGMGENGEPLSGEVIGVDYQAGRPILVTTNGDIALDKVDEARMPSGAAPSNSSTPGTPGPTES
ncbi:MAG: flagellar hook assembly protein FlgD [Acidimicrobiales bacterium]